MSENEINQTIADCRLCSSLQGELKKTAVTSRGADPKVMIVGRNPGNTEMKTTVPFSGQSGVRLNEWLIGCGNPADNPRQSIYLTSVIKCFCDDSKKTFKKMAINCSPIIAAQVQLHKPKLVITLGADSFDSVKFVDRPFSAAVFEFYNSEEHVLFTKLQHHFVHLVWPHPSPLSRFLNEAENKLKLEATFENVRNFLGD